MGGAQPQHGTIVHRYASMSRQPSNPAPATMVPIARAWLDRLPAPLAFELPDGQRIESAGRAALATIVFRNDAVLASLLSAPSLLGFGEAFIAGEVDIEGDLIAALEAAYAADAFLGSAPPARFRPPNRCRGSPSPLRSTGGLLRALSRPPNGLYLRVLRKADRRARRSASRQARSRVSETRVSPPVSGFSTSVVAGAASPRGPRTATRSTRSA